MLRELLLGPKRFSELERSLSGVGPNRLSARLRTLQSVGVIVKTSDRRYTLTGLGEGLRTPILGLATWGLGLTGGHLPAEPRADMVALTISSMARPAHLGNQTARAEVTCADETFTITIDHRGMQTRSGPAASTDTPRLRCTGETFVDLALGRTSLEAAIDSGDATSEGDQPELAAVITAMAAAVRDARAAARAPRID